MTTSRRMWAVMGLVLVAALAVGARRPAGPATEDQRVHHITARLRCPTCHGLSAEASDAPSSEAIRDEVGLRVHEGETDTQVVDYLVSRYGEGILLEPKATGVGLLVWALPIGGAAAAVAALALVLRRGRVRGGRAASGADRDLVEEALRR